MSSNSIYYSDCRHFLGYMPCRLHKLYNVICSDCNYYDKTDGIILIIKLGAIGDVIRTTALLHRIKKEYPFHKIWWLTYSPEIVPSIVDKVFNFDVKSLEIIKNCSFDLLINLDKDFEACALTLSVNSKLKRGFILKNNVPAPIDELAEHKFLTGLFDDLNKENQKSYLDEIFEICGWEFNGEEYILDNDKHYEWNFNNEGRKIIGLNTGCGARWISRLWSDQNWIDLIFKLQQDGFYPLLLGGSQEDEKNKYFASVTGADYKGFFGLKQFISEVDQCDVVVSAVTMGMHIAVGMKKPLILMNNIFNPKEFELYGRGEIVMPDKECHCFFSPKCKNEEYFCMEHLPPQKIFDAVKRWG